MNLTQHQINLLYHLFETMFKTNGLPQQQSLAHLLNKIGVDTLEELWMLRDEVAKAHEAGDE